MLGTNPDFTDQWLNKKKKKKKDPQTRIYLDRRLGSGTPDSHSETLGQKQSRRLS